MWRSLCMMAVFFWVGAPFAQTPPFLGDQGQASLAWDAPTQNENGSPLDDLAGYRLYYGETSQAGATAPVGYPSPLPYDNVVDVADPSALMHVISGLSPGVWYFRATAYDASGNESVFSNEFSGVIGITPVTFLSCS